MQHVPAVDFDAVAAQLGEAGHAPHVGGHAEVLFQQLGGRDRVAALDGHLRIHSPAGKGTRITAELPCGW